MSGAVPSLGNAQHVRVLGSDIYYMPAIQPGAVSVIEQITPPHDGPPLHLHRHEDEILRVIQGEHRVRIGQNDVKAVPGDTLFLPRGIPHTYVNCGERQSHVIFIVRPGGLERYFVELADALQIDPTQEPKIRAKYGVEYIGPNPFIVAPSD
jgi:quercetin dioxygenase-like cupin family protein